MTTITILPESPGSPTTAYCAVAGQLQSVGRTVGQALDALTSLLSATESGTLLVVQQLRPDGFFTAEQQQRLGELMARWRAARDGGVALSAQEQTELEALVEAEVKAAAARADALLRGRVP